jgi:hypothetical protein
MRETVTRGPNRVTTGPASGSATTDPAAVASNTKPSCDAFKPSSCLTCGIREAQLAKQKPMLTKAA